jgi:hypothetical protein
MRRLISGLAVAAGLFFASIAPSHAGVTITFYSHKFRLIDGLASDYPHGFAILSGTNNAGQPVNVDMGFSATTLYAMALLVPLDGALDDPYTGDYVATATPHFSFPLSEAQYQAVLATADKWRNAKQPSYDFYTRNCVTFIRDIAVAAGLSVSYSRDFIHDPKGFLDDAAIRNRPFLAQYGNRFQGGPQPAPMTASLPGQNAPATADAPVSAQASALAPAPH